MLTVTSQTFLPYDRSSDGTTNYQDGVLGDKYSTVINFYWQKGTFIAKNQNIALNLAISGNTISDNTSYSAGQSPENFLQEFSIGETIKIPNSSLNTAGYVITGLSASTITVGTSLTAENPTSYIWVSTLITGLDFFYNLLKVGSQPSFFSLTDPNVQQKYTVSGLNAGSTTPILFKIGTSSYSWATDTVTGNVSQCSIAGVSITSDFKQQFTLTHTYFITPLSIASQLSAFKNALTNPVNPIPPPIYPLAYYYQFNTYYTSGTPNIVDTTQGNSIGVASWVDTNNSGTSPEFSCSFISYSDASTGLPLTSLDFGKTNLVQMSMNSATGQFINPEDGEGNTFILSHIFLSQNPSTYQNTKTTLRQNALHDRAIQVASAGSVNGEFYGTNYQIFSGVTVTYVSANVCTLSFTVTYSAAAQVIIKSLSNWNYALLCCVE